MRIKNVTELPDGSVTFQGNLTGPELAFVIEVGINRLVQEGAVPFVSKKSINPVDMHIEGSEAVN